MTCSIPGICSKSPECADKHCEGFPTRRVHQPWDSEQVERPLEASDGAVLAVLFLGILFLFGVPLFIEVVLR